MNSSRFVLDLNNTGKVFKNKIADLILFDSNYGTTIDHKRIIQYIYTESVNQIMNILDGNVDEFSLKLLFLPDFKYFTHVIQFNNDICKHDYSLAFREFALNILFIVHQKLGISTNRDYLLETVTDDYIIINVIDKGYN